MKYTPTEVDGVVIVDIQPHHDERGFFARSFCADEFTKHGFDAAVAQTSISYNRTRGTLRGLHRQVAPFQEAKLVRCTRGAIVDVALDVRPESSTYGRHAMVELSADNRRALFLPAYVAHGFQTLEDDTEVTYQISGPYAPDSAQGFRWDDEAFDIQWPLPVSVISEKDANWPSISSTREAAR